MSRLIRPALVLLMISTLPAHGASTAPRAGSVAAQTLSVNGVACLEVVSWSGGDGRASVVLEPPASGASAKKHLGSVAYHAITVEAAFPLSQTLLDCLADLCANRTNRKTLLLANLDHNFQVIGSQLEATQALLTEAHFPAFDASVREAARVTLVFQAELVRPATIGSSSAAASAAGRTSPALTSNFQLSLTGLNGGTISRIEPFVIKRSITADSVGDARNYQREPGRTEVPNLSLTLGGAAPADWVAWHDDFVVKGNCADSKEKSGTLKLWSGNLQNTLFSLDLMHVGIMRLSFQPVIGDVQVGRSHADLYCETMTVGGGASGTNSPGGSTASGSAATTPSPAAAPSLAPAIPGSIKELAPPETPADPRAPIAAGATPRSVVPGTPSAASPALTTAPAPVADATPIVAPQVAPAPRAPTTTVTSPDDKGARDPANFHRPEGTVRTAYTALRQKGYVMETASYSAATNADSFMTFYEKVLGGDGWEETGRNENNYGTNGSHQIISTWKKETRSVTLTIVDIGKDKVQIQVSVEVKS